MEKNLIAAMREKIEARKEKSAWGRGVNVYALEMLDDLEIAEKGGFFDAARILEPRYLRSALLNGADSWNQYSWGGSSLNYNSDICERLCAPWEIRKTRCGERRPNSREEWLDTQARALFQAANRVARAARECVEG